MAFKQLSDQLKFRALPAFLSLFDDLDAMLLTFAVDNRIQFMLAEQFLAVDTDFSAGVKKRVFEDMLRIAHFGAQTIATSFRPGQHVVWITDSDDIVANERCEQIFGKVAGVVLKSFLRSETIESLSFAVTSIPDPTLQLEDFASVPDLVAGAVGETLSALAASGLHVTGGVCLERPRVSGKTDLVCQWLARESSVGKIGVVFEKVGSGVWDWRPNDIRDRSTNARRSGPTLLVAVSALPLPAARTFPEEPNRPRKNPRAECVRRPRCFVMRPSA